MIVEVGGPHPNFNGCFSGYVELGRNYAMHTGFTTEDQAKKWVKIISHKIQSQSKEVEEAR